MLMVLPQMGMAHLMSAQRSEEFARLKVVRLLLWEVLVWQRPLTIAQHNVLSAII